METSWTEGPPSHLCFAKGIGKGLNDSETVGREKDRNRRFFVRLARTRISSPPKPWRIYDCLVWTMNLCQVFQGLLMVKAMHVRDSAWQGLHHVICHPSVGKTILPATWGAKRGSIHQAKGAVYITNTPRVSLPFALPHRLWYHELSRVFCDRLISKADKDRHAIPTYPI